MEISANIDRPRDPSHPVSVSLFTWLVVEALEGARGIRLHLDIRLGVMSGRASCFSLRLNMRVSYRAGRLACQKSARALSLGSARGHLTGGVWGSSDRIERNNPIRCEGTESNVFLGPRRSAGRDRGN